MSNPAPPLAPAAAVARTLRAVAGARDHRERVAALSAYFMGRPYVAFSLIGSSDQPEQLVTRIDGFDCVTFAESVYALALSEHPAAFPRHLRQLRYLDGEVRWAARNHFMNRWIQRNIDAGWVEPLLESVAIETGEVRELSALPGYPAQRWPVRYVPSSAQGQIAAHAATGDLVAFVSNRPELDTFHVGLLVPGDPLRVRHAGRTAGHVLEEPLADFLTRNDVPGMLLARPVSASRAFTSMPPSMPSPGPIQGQEDPVHPITVLLTAGDDPDVTVPRLAQSGLVGASIVLVPAGQATGRTEIGGIPCTEIETAQPASGAVVTDVLERTGSPVLLQVSGAVDPHPTALRRMVDQVVEGDCGMVFGDYMDLQDDGRVTGHPLSDYQAGSLQDAFPFGPLQMWSVGAAKAALATHGGLEGLQFMGWYDLRLKLSQQASIMRLPEPLCTLRPLDRRKTGEQQFDYLMASRDAQVEAEKVCTRYLDRIGARLSGPFQPFVPAGGHPVLASVVIPVRDRVRTIIDAVTSVLEQETDFEFNVIVVDNHSSDGTTEALRERAAQDPRLVHVVPDRQALGIGGCWNVAVNHEQAGTYVVQLDSDDVYSGKDTLARIVNLFREQQCGMVVGSYTLVNMQLEELSPGLIDHREWTDDNGPNNALRIGGLGAPRAFATELVRKHAFPNASYGEDYAIVLRLCRQYKVGRIYDSLYLVRRWEDNSDADLPPEKKARFQAYKDRLRTLEISARVATNRRGRA